VAIDTHANYFPKLFFTHNQIFIYVLVSDIVGLKRNQLLPTLSTAFIPFALNDSQLSPTCPQAHPQETLCSGPSYLYVEALGILF
jgi:hypothetical protein